ncbi:hypothetical protein KAFR_0L01250 [Kazachstania africana CBS 2517]|uniref:Uncharacterized protein n=1 Tax=Kazachstania africana (strain ATCC 22294 / BCRC 22015 / CBS 2517 / CECT 1963 / NBRC 1671 / NRRL Y-8276) TaxID=1071382 RepID=H2B283_KAZAF|nr:hypothetical protein KAFR_0L01250 [Kazachstania africana CBS 2517]CCF60733.1 hypothetical protein KAFR_0L01250 [Kazachstania africana CBS 2517]
MLRSVRYLNTAVKDSTINDYLKDTLKFIVIPLHHNMNFIYFKHTNDLLNKKSKLIATENWLIQKTIKMWNKLEKSDNKVSQKFVKLMQSLIDKVSIDEKTLMSIPGESYLLKRTKELGPLTSKQYKNSNSPLKIKLIKVYYPSNRISKVDLTNKLTALHQNGLKLHRRRLWQCLIGIPLTFPIILIPIIPNLPGFYLTYRAYCNFKAYLGAKHLKSIMEDELLEYSNLKEYSRLLAQDANVNIDTITRLLEIDELQKFLTTHVTKNEKS